MWRVWPHPIFIMLREMQSKLKECYHWVDSTSLYHAHCVTFLLRTANLVYSTSLYHAHCVTFLIRTANLFMWKSWHLHEQLSGTRSVCVDSHNTDKLHRPKFPWLLPCPNGSVTQMSAAVSSEEGVLSCHQLVVPEPLNVANQGHTVWEMEVKSLDSSLCSTASRPIQSVLMYSSPAIRGHSSGRTN
jgi:hypothetical protein